MPSPSTLAAFSVTALLFVLFPGPAMLFLVARGVAGGPRAGALSAFGVETANAVYVVATALGLTAVLAASSTAFAVVRFAGAAYLVYLGVRTLRERADAQAPVLAAGSVTAWTSWRQGFLVGIGNPKAALFFLAFFPQFIHPEAGAAWTQVLVLGAVIIAIGTVLDVSYGIFGGLVRSRLARRSPRGVRRGRIAVGLTYIGLGGLTAATGHRAG
jgi:threonine/homoserine/homoserine lactone efflux protein